MDVSRLDRLAREFAGGEISRRGAIKGLGGIGAAALLPAFLVADEAQAKCPPKRRCGRKCCPKGATCKHGKCKCKHGRKKCGKHCVDLRNDPKHCGACGRRCESGQTCQNGECRGGSQTATAVCGDGVAQDGEQCDGADLRGATCASLGLGSGALRCASNCTYDTSDCAVATVCGDGVAQGGEQCDGADLRGATCVSLGFSSGALGCASDCTYDTSGCVAAGVCGDGTIDPGEECDGLNLGGATCQSLGFTGGTLVCASDCTYDLSGCTLAECSTDGDCPQGSSGDCMKAVCVDGTCGFAVDDTDLPSDGNDCTADLCSGGVASHPPLPPATPCPGGFCNGSGVCVAV